MRKELQYLLKVNPGSEVKVEKGNGGYNGEYEVTVLYLPKDKVGQIAIDAKTMEVWQLDSETLEIREKREYADGMMSRICYAKRKRR